MNWVWLHFPPVFISDGPMKNQGFVSQWLPGLQADVFPSRQHQFQAMTPARAWQTMKDGEFLCHPAALRDQKRTSFAIFSEPWSLAPDKAILMRRDTAERLFPGQQVISAADLFIREDLRLGLIQDANYYVHIAPWLDGSVAEDKAVRLSNKQPLTQLYRLLVNNRIDYMIEYPWIGGYLKRLLAMQGKRQPVEIVSLAIKELPEFTPVYIACTKSPEGEQAIAGINQWLGSRRKHEAFRQHIGAWLDNISRQRFIQAYEAMIVPVTEP